MEASQKGDFSKIGKPECKLFEKISYTEIYICHIRFNMEPSELKEFIREKYKKNKLTIVITNNKDLAVTDIKQVGDNIYLVFPDNTENYTSKLLTLVKDIGVSNVEIISHGRLNVKKLLEEEGISVDFYDVTSSIKELYDRYTKLEEFYNDEKKFSELLEEIKDFYFQRISLPLLIKKLIHRLAGQVANISLTEELFRRGEETEEDITKTLLRLKELISFAKREIKQSIKNTNSGKEVENLRKINEVLENLEDTLNHVWIDMLRAVRKDLQEAIVYIKKLKELDNKDENTYNR